MTAGTVGDLEATIAALSAEIRERTAAGDRRQAALACVALGNLFANVVGNLTAARAWFVRAGRLVEEEPPCVEQGWVAVAGVGCNVDDPAALLARSELALDRARRFGDMNLEAKAMANAGLAHVQAGQVAEGMAMLDEAMALVCGPADDAWAAGESVCSFFTACYYATDFGRASSWADDLRRCGLLGPAAGMQAFVSSHCDSLRAALLCELGRWGEAETLLLRAIDEFQERMHAPAWHPAIVLADLRIRQGRLADAERLLVGKESYLDALLPAARLHLARGDLELARATAARGLRAVRGDRLRAVDLLAVLVDAALGAGDVEGALAACDSMVARADGLPVPELQARVATVRARVLDAGGDGAAAVAVLEAALDELPTSGAPLLRAELLLGLVRMHDAAGHRAAAQVDAGRATAALAGLDVLVPAADQALLRRVCGAPPGAMSAELRRDDRGFLVSCDGVHERVPDTKGLRYLAELVADPGVERHALDLVDRVEGVGAVDRRSLGDAGALADGAARAAYRRRAEALRAEIDEAMEIGALDRADALQEELDGLVAELARAFGMGGRDRKASSAAERARVNVTRALRAAAARLAEAVPEAGAALDRSLRTGLFCAYEPADDDAVRWVFRRD
ncbi:MAG TPA: hypothetical protein VFJ85_06585 [Acidimicrobiales bacterium]|nr:hypothetical protein [Acidimicrobiales bacterium]